MTTSPPTAALLQAQGLAFARNDEPVFGPLDFALARGETLLVEGDNGSGKTTLLRVLAGLMPASAGELRFDEAPLRRESLAGRALFLGHQLGLKLDLSAVENLRHFVALYGQRDGLAPAAALDEVGLAGYAEEPVRRLSAGQKKRAALARLLLAPAELWLLDEPFANLDRHGIALVNRLLAAHAARGGAALVTSHGAVSFTDPSTRHLRLELRA